MYLNSHITASSPVKYHHLSHSYTIFIIFIIITLALPPTLSNYIGATITPNSYILNAYTTYTFTLLRNLNPVTSFINSITTLPDTAVVLLVFPKEYQPFQGTITPSCVNLQTQSILQCTMNTQNNTLTINSIFT
jgi:hypothetical protein